MSNKILSVKEFEMCLEIIGIYLPDDGDAIKCAVRIDVAYRTLHDRKDATTWEDNHQRTALERHGLADEFPFGCDAIDHVAGALVASRKRVAKLTPAPKPESMVSPAKSYRTLAIKAYNADKTDEAFVLFSKALELCSTKQSRGDFRFICNATGRDLDAELVKIVPAPEPEEGGDDGGGE